MLGDFSFPKPLRSVRLQRALHSAMFTSKYRGATEAHEAVASSQFQALTRQGGSQSSRGTTAAFRSMLMRSATSGDADVAVAPTDVFCPRLGTARGFASNRRDTSDHQKLLIKSHGFVVKA